MGTGFSYTDRPDAYATNVATVASDMLVLLKHFFTERAEFQVCQPERGILDQKWINEFDQNIKWIKILQTKTHTKKNTHHTVIICCIWYCWIWWVFGSLQSVPFYVFSESYGGKMAAAISLELTKVSLLIVKSAADTGLCTQSTWAHWYLIILAYDGLVGKRHALNYS